MIPILRPDPGNDRHFVDIEQVPENTKRSIRQGFFMLGRDLMKTASTEILRRPKSGITYIRRDRAGRRRRHVASAAFETHANMTGKTRRSIGYVVRGALSMDFGYGVDGKQTSEWGPMLEFGTF